MTRFEQRPSSGIYAALAVGMMGVFVADFYTPLGIAVWVLYLVPLIFTMFLWRPGLPLGLALTGAGLLLLGLLISPPGMGKAVAVINRSFGIVTLCVVGFVGHAFVKNKLAVRRQQWIQSAQTGLSQRMAGEQNLTELSDNVLRFLAEYLEAQAGALFVEETGAFLLRGRYAIPPGSRLREQFTFGEGLLGQAARDQRPVVVNDVPEGYLAIGSGLGSGLPRHLLIGPLVADRRVQAVVELGFVQPVDSVELELLERLSESIAVAVRSAQYRNRLQELLDQTQRQAEALQTQSEELRVSNEELAEQARALKDSQTRLEVQQVELEQTNAQLEEQTQLLEAQRDDLARAKTDLEAQARELEQASRYKSEFLANMSHELRTPLNSSLILAKLLADNREGNLTEEQIRYANTIHSAGNDLLALITDILDLAKIEAGRMELKLEQVPLWRLLESLNRTFQPMAAQRALVFRTSVAPEVPESFETDPQRLEQVLRNLVSNALKFTESGEVAFEVSRRADGRLAFAVRDTGIGIPLDQQQLVFQPFHQADGTAGRKYGGTGLGLSISRELAHLLSGEIELKSAPGTGSIFTVILPERPTPAKPHRVALPEPVATKAGRPLDGNGGSAAGTQKQQAPEAPKRSELRSTAKTPARDDRGALVPGRRSILIVEDDPAFAAIVLDLAHEMGFQAVVATTAAEGTELALQLLPSAVVLDVGLPDNSGLSVLDRLKSEPRTRHIPVHIISGSDHAQRALSLGAVGYMLKPVRREQLVETFEQLKTRLAHQVRRVLVVEDDPVQLDSMKELLKSRAVEALGTQTASQCLDLLRTTTVDCLVLDLSLPDASGFSLLEMISREDYAFPPVIVYTGRDLTAGEEQQLRRYSQSIIIKGARSPERLLDEVTLFLHQVVSDLPPEQQRMIEQARHRDAALEGRRILVVEDDVRNVFALTSILEPRGAQVQIARNGREALEALDASRQGNSPPVDLVLMDIMMPEMDGLTAMRHIRSQPEWKKLPIIALTAKAMKDDQEQCLQAGANDYMAKPLEIEKLLSLIRVWIPR
jgi:CheY-like chemotaxis protein